MADPFDLQSDMVTLAEMRNALPWRVFKLNDCDWYVARSLDEAKDAAAKDWGCTSAQAVKDHMFFDERELTAEDMRRLKFVDDDENGNRRGPSRFFSTELSRRVAAGLSAAELFASTEY